MNDNRRQPQRFVVAAELVPHSGTDARPTADPITENPHEAESKNRRKLQFHCLHLGRFSSLEFVKNN